MLQIKAFTFNPFAENTYIAYDETAQAVVFDPGCYAPNERKMLTAFIADKGLKIQRLINTHCHLDHIFGNAFVEETYGVPLECHRAEIPVLERAPMAGQMYGTPLPAQKIPTEFIEDNAEISFGNTVCRAILAPGHSPGSLCFYFEKEKILIGGDVLFFGSIGRTDLPGGSHQQLLQSIEQRLMVLPDDVKVYSGHGQTTTIGYERHHNPFLKK
jgi:hydroxyacylglutathione hydrolase